MNIKYAYEFIKVKIVTVFLLTMTLPFLSYGQTRRVIERSNPIHGSCIKGGTYVSIFGKEYPPRVKKEYDGIYYTPPPPDTTSIVTSKYRLTTKDVTIFSCDTARNGLKYEASTDVQGNYRIEKVLPGEYFMVIRSGNTTDCPEDHLRKIIFYSKCIKQFYGFDISEFQSALDSISALDSFYHSILLDKDTTKRRNEHLTRREWRRIYSIHEDQKRQMAADLLNRLPEKFRSDIEIYTEYSRSHDYTYIIIKEDENVHENTDFGTTCI
jgi:hypothetical protein